MNSEPGSPMTLGNPAAARVRLIVWCRECRIVGAKNAAIRSSPTPPRWLLGMAPIPRSRLARAVGPLPLAQLARRYGGEWERSGAHKSLGVGTRRRIVDHIGRLIWPGYRDRARWVLVRRRCRGVAWRLRRGAWRLRCVWLLSKGRRDCRDWCAAFWAGKDHGNPHRSGGTGGGSAWRWSAAPWSR